MMAHGTSLLLLHGFAASSAIWRPTMAALAGRRCVAFDWPGFGARGGEPPCCDLAGFTAEALRQADAQGLAHFDVLGHSMAGFVVQELLCSHPRRVRRAVLYGAGLRIDPRRRFESAERTVARLREEGVASCVRRVTASWFARGEDDPDHAACAEDGKRMSEQAGIAAVQAMQRADFTGRLGGVTAPVLVILGEHDHTHPPEAALALRQAIAGASLCVLPGCGHAAHLERQSWFNAVVADFLDRP